MTSARDFGIVVVRSSGDEENVICPFHSDSSPSASFNRSKGLFYCYVCAVGYNVAQLAEKLDVDLDEIEDGVEVLQDYDFITDETPLELGKPVLGISDCSYFKKRGIDATTCYIYGLHFKDGSFPSAVFPVPNVRGDVIGAVYRFIDPKGNRYVKVGRMTPVWPIRFLPIFKEGAMVVVCEGVFSALRLSSFGNILALSLFGAKANQSIVDVLSPFRPVFLYDDDKAGRTACRKMRKLNPTAFSFTLSVAPDDMSDDQLTELLGKIREKVE